eukprot:1303832-Pleurochrysis_carterae.AAC.1
MTNLLSSSRSSLAAPSASSADSWSSATSSPSRYSRCAHNSSTLVGCAETRACISSQRADTREWTPSASSASAAQNSRCNSSTRSSNVSFISRTCIEKSPRFASEPKQMPDEIC